MHQRTTPISEAFVPSCPSCGYDLRGTPKNRCPECGSAFDRAKVFDPAQSVLRAPSRANILIILSVALSMIGFGFGNPYSDLKGLAHLAVVWLLAFAWLIARRREILGPKPWLVLWLLLVATFAPNRPNLTPTQDTAVIAFSILIAAAATGYSALRRPADTARLLLYTLAVLLALGGGMLVLTAVVSALFGMSGASYRFPGVNLPAGGTNDAIAAAVGVTHLIAAYVACRGARRIARWQAEQTGL